MTYPRARSTGRQPRSMASGELKPMKGAFLILNEATHEFITKALHDVGETYSDERAEQDPEEILFDLIKGSFDDPSGLEWRPAEDDFGSKAYVAMPYALANQPGQAAELRVTVVILKKDGTVNIDIRTWGQY